MTKLAKALDRACYPQFQKHLQQEDTLPQAGVHSRARRCTNKDNSTNAAQECRDCSYSYDISPYTPTPSIIDISTQISYTTPANHSYEALIRIAPVSILLQDAGIDDLSTLSKRFRLMLVQRLVAEDPRTVPVP